MFGRALSRRDKKKANTATDPIAAKLGSHVENISANEEGFAVMGRMGKTRIGRKDISPPRETTLRSHQQVPTYGDHVETPPSQSFINPLSSNPIQSPRTPRTPPIIPPETPVQGRGRYMNPIRELPTPKDDQTPDDWPLPSFAQADGKNQPRGRGHFTEAAGPASKQLDMAAIKAPKKRRFGGLFSRKSSSPDPDPRLHTPDSTDYELKKNAAFSEMRTVLARNEAAQNPSSEKVKKEPRLTRKLSRRGPPRKAAVKARVNADRRISRMSRLVEGPTDLSLLEPPSASNSLNVEIPSVELERYSIMFASVLDQKQYPSIASRRASRRSSRSRSRARNIPSPSQIKVCRQTSP